MFDFIGLFFGFSDPAKTVVEVDTRLLATDPLATLSALEFELDRLLETVENEALVLEQLMEASEYADERSRTGATGPEINGSSDGADGARAKSGHNPEGDDGGARPNVRGGALHFGGHRLHAVRTAAPRPPSGGGAVTLAVVRTSSSD